ncbi:MAG: toprim domain-containing protein, partial [Novosphingobium sp.]
GYAPEGRQALKAALSQFPEEKLIEAGLRIAVDQKEPYDRFRGRLMLPIEDARGRVIAFGGRILDAAKIGAPKYLNSPDTPLFDKGRTLYNLHRAGPLSRQSGRLLVVEGYMDVIALAAAGIGYAVAPLGTALTERQIELLWRLVEVPVLCFDGDAAGQRAAMRAVTRTLPLLRPAHSLKIVGLPAGLDPDDLLRRDGPAAMERLLGEAGSLIDALWSNERDAVPLVTPEDKAGLKARLKALVDTIADPDIRALYWRDLQERFSAYAFPRREQKPWQPAKTEWRGGGRTPLPQRSSPADTQRLRQSSTGGARAALASAILSGLVRWPSEIERHADYLVRAAVDDPRFDLLLDAHDRGEPLESAHLEAILAENDIRLPPADRAKRLAYPFVTPGVDAILATGALAAAIEKFVEEPAIDAAIEAATERQDHDEQQRLRIRKRNLGERLRELTSRQQA